MNMDLHEFKDSLAESQPPSDTRPELRALWKDAKGDWDAAHKIIQSEDGEAAAWVHAYLHRKEGDSANASFWYRRAGKTMSRSSLEEEWLEIAIALLKLGEDRGKKSNLES